MLAILETTSLKYNYPEKRPKERIAMPYQNILEKDRTDNHFNALLVPWRSLID